MFCDSPETDATGTDARVIHVRDRKQLFLDERLPTKEEQCHERLV